MRPNTFLSCLGSLAILAFVMFSSVAHAQRATAIGTKAEPTKLAECLPPAVQRLLQWPEDAVLNASRHVDWDSTEVMHVWNRMVLDPSWQPPKNTRTYLIPHEFENRDAIRLRWLKDNYIVQVSETASIFTIKITPRDGSEMGTDSVERTAIARQLCLDVFAKEGIRHTLQGEPVKIPDLNQKIVSLSFDPMSIKSLDAGASSWGQPKGHPRYYTEIDADPAETVEKKSRDDDPANPDWMNTDQAWKYWFHLVFWANDGKSVAFYLSKQSGGGPTFDYTAMRYHDASLFFYSAAHDEEWFLPQELRRHRPSPTPTPTPTPTPQG